jgi:hypothetical protein
LNFKKRAGRNLPPLALIGLTLFSSHSKRL